MRFIYKNYHISSKTKKREALFGVCCIFIALQLYFVNFIWIYSKSVIFEVSIDFYNVFLSSLRFSSSVDQYYSFYHECSILTFSTGLNFSAVFSSFVELSRILGCTARSKIGVRLPQFSHFWGIFNEIFAQNSFSEFMGRNLAILGHFR